MTKEDISISNYGDYSSSNYGSSRKVRIGELELYFSYETVVAFDTPETGFECCENCWGPTTGKHLNMLEPDHKARLGRDSFDKLLEKTLKGYKLIKSSK